jgi:hypothetical protein
VVLERGPHSLVSTIEELLGRNNNDSGLENRDYGRGNPLRWPRDTIYPQKSALTSPKRGGRSVGTICLRTKATEFVLFVCSKGTIASEIVIWRQQLPLTRLIACETHCVPCVLPRLLLQIAHCGTLSQNLTHCHWQDVVFLSE